MTFIDCATKCGDTSFREKPFDEFDGLILSNIFYCEFQTFIDQLTNPPSIPLEDLLKTMIAKSNMKTASLGLLLGSKPLRLAEKVSKSSRFKDVAISDFEEINDYEKNTQFAAVCYHIGKNLIYLCFRGTDDSLIGWLENLIVFTEENLPSQLIGRDYLNRMMQKYPNANFILGGHSKGGNICVYAGTYCEPFFQNRIKQIYSYDGTGFYPNTFSYEKFKILESRTTLIAPYDCIIGNILEQPIKNRIIVACNKIGLFCHDVHTWLTEEGHLKQTKKQVFSNRSVATIKSFNTMVYQQSYEKRKEFVINFDKAVKSCGARTLNDLKKNAGYTLHIFRNLSAYSKSLLSKTIYFLITNNFRLN